MKLWYLLPICFPKKFQDNQSNVVPPQDSWNMMLNPLCFAAFVHNDSVHKAPAFLHHCTDVADFALRHT